MANKRQITERCPWGVIPDTHPFPFKLQAVKEEEVAAQMRQLKHISNICRIVRDQFIIEISYRLDLARRVKEGTALESEKVWSKVKGEYVFPKSIGYMELTYVLQDMRNSPFFSNLKDASWKDVKVWTLQETVRATLGGFQSWIELRKQGDPDARPPRMSFEDKFESIISKNILIKSRVLNLEGVSIVIPRSTFHKLRGRKCAHVIIEQAGHLGKFKVRAVPVRPAPMPKQLVRAVGVDVGSTGVGWCDSRGRTYFAKVRRPDYLVREKIGSLDSQMRDLRANLKSQGFSRKQVELDNRYRHLADERAKLYERMQNQWKDHRKKLVDKLVQFGDVFFVGKSIVRSKEGKEADTYSGDTQKNWNYQNTGYASEIIRLLAWRARRAGKQVVEVPDLRIDEKEYKIRKIKQAKAHLVYGMWTETFQEILGEQYRSLLDGVGILEDFLSNGDHGEYSEDEMKVFHAELDEARAHLDWFQACSRKQPVVFGVWDSRHQQAISKIVEKIDPSKFTRVKIKPS